MMIVPEAAKHTGLSRATPCSRQKGDLWWFSIAYIDPVGRMIRGAVARVLVERVRDAGSAAKGVARRAANSLLRRNNSLLGADKFPARCHGNSRFGAHDFRSCGRAGSANLLFCGGFLPLGRDRSLRPRQKNSLRAGNSHLRKTALGPRAGCIWSSQKPGAPQASLTASRST
jgi:hypothetical protein